VGSWLVASRDIESRWPPESRDIATVVASVSEARTDQNRALVAAVLREWRRQEGPQALLGELNTLLDLAAQEAAEPLSEESLE
jgi:hypothetical protein